MADSSNSTAARPCTRTVFRGAAPKFAHRTLRVIMCTSGLYEIYLNGCGQVMVRRKTGAYYSRAFTAVNVEHAVALAQSGELARAEATAAR